MLIDIITAGARVRQNGFDQDAPPPKKKNGRFLFALTSVSDYLPASAEHGVKAFSKRLPKCFACQ